MLKLLAIILMTLDHLGVYMMPLMPRGLYILLRVLGRLAFPIFAYFLAKGYRRSTHLFRYSLRLLALAFLSEPVIAYAKALVYLPNDSRNILFTLCLGIVFLAGYELFAKGQYDRLVRLQPLGETGGPRLPHHYRFNLGIHMHPLLAYAIGGFFMGLSLFAAWHFKTDYDIYGVLTIFLFYLAEERQDDTSKAQFALSSQALLNLFFIASSNSLALVPVPALYDFMWAPIQGFAVLGALLAYRVKEQAKKPHWFEKYFFYLYYPLHILCIAWLSMTLRS